MAPFASSGRRTLVIEYAKRGSELKSGYENKGVMVEAGGDCGMGGVEVWAAAA